MSSTAPQPLQRPLTPAMKELMRELEAIVSNPVVEAAYNDAIARVAPFIEEGSPNPWVGQSIHYFVDYFRDWFTFLPEPTGGLGKIVPFTWFYLNNPTAAAFLNTFKSKSHGATKYTTEIFNWTVKFIMERGRFMDSPESLLFIKEWTHDPTTHIEDFIVPAGGFKSFNEFFTRELNLSRNPRLIAAPDDDSVVNATADSEINFILSDLTLTQELNVKSRQLNVLQLLNNSQYARFFEGGTAISCVLMPQNYHHFHAPVTGTIVESMEVAGMYNGITDGNTGSIPSLMSAKVPPTSASSSTSTAPTTSLKPSATAMWPSYPSVLTRSAGSGPRSSITILPSSTPAIRQCP